MNRAAYGKALLTVLALAAAGCDGCTTKLTQAKGSFVMSPKLLDFHTVCLDSTSEFQLTLQNDGRGSLTILSLTFSNPAFTLLEPLPTSISPHKVVVVKVGFTPTVAMDYSGQLTIKTDSFDNATQTATLVGTGFSGADRDFEVSCLCDSDSSSGLVCGLTGAGHMTQQPCNFLSFGKVLNGTAVERTVTVRNLGCQPVNFTQATFYDDTDTAPDAARHISWFSIAPAPPAPIRGGSSTDYVVKFTAPAEGIGEPQFVRLKLASDDPSMKSLGQPPGTFDVGLFGSTVSPALLVNPNILTYFDAQMNLPDTKQFTISNTGTSTLHIDSVTVVGNAGTHDFTLSGLPGGQTSFDLGATGAANNQVVVNAILTATTAGSESATVTVTAGADTQKVHLIGGAVPQIGVTWIDPTDQMEKAPPVLFGQVVTGGTAQRTVRIRNGGQADLVVSALATTNPSTPATYSVATFNSTTIAPGMLLDVTVNMTDNISLRDDTGALVISSNDPLDVANGGSRTVELKSTNDPDYKPVPAISVSAIRQNCKPLTLDGSGSTASSPADTLNFLWALTVKPNGSTASISTPTAPMTSVVSSTCMGPDLPGIYVFTLTVGDQFPNNTNTISQSVTVQ